MKKFVFVKSGKSIIKINIDDIVVIQGLGNYTQVHTIDLKKLTYYNSLRGLIDNLPKEFMRVHNSYIINLNHIDKIENNHIYLIKHKVPISLSKKKYLQIAINEYSL